MAKVIRQVEWGAKVIRQVEWGAKVIRQVEWGAKVIRQVEWGAKIIRQVEWGAKVIRQVRGGQAVLYYPMSPKFFFRLNGANTFNEVTRIISTFWSSTYVHCLPVWPTTAIRSLFFGEV